MAARGLLMRTLLRKPSAAVKVDQERKGLPFFGSARNDERTDC